MPPGLPAKFITSEMNCWLVKQGLLEDTFISGKKYRAPTDAVESAGFIPDGFQSIKTNKAKLSPEGMQFVLDHLKEIAAFWRDW